MSFLQKHKELLCINLYLSDTASSIPLPLLKASLGSLTPFEVKLRLLSQVHLPCKPVRLSCAFQSVWDCWKQGEDDHFQRQPGKSMHYPFSSQICQLNRGFHSHYSYSSKLTSNASPPCLCGNPLQCWICARNVTKVSLWKFWDFVLRRTRSFLEALTGYVSSPAKLLEKTYWERKRKRPWDYGKTQRERGLAMTVP